MSPSTDNALAALMAQVTRAPDEVARRDAFARGFASLRAGLDLHPHGSRPSVAYQAAAGTARSLASVCLPLGLAVVMHLYPLCALRCAPMPWWSDVHRGRVRLLRTIDGHGLLLANAGSERATGTPATVTLAHTSWGIRIDGAFDYVSLANVADLLLFNAPLSTGGGTVFCVASLRAQSTHVGPPAFGGRMRLSDTCPVSFEGHLVAANRYLDVPSPAALSCMAKYQRSWFQLLVSEAYLARIARLREQWCSPPAAEDIASLNELALLREYALRLLDESASPGVIHSLSQVTHAIKLRVSWQAQATGASVRSHDVTSAEELGFLRRQPTADDRIVRDLRAAHAATVPLSFAQAASRHS